MRKKTISKLAMLLALAIAATPAFAHTASIQMAGNSRYKALRLTPEIYNNANSDLSDLLVVDSSGQNAPYFIHNTMVDTSASYEAIPMKLANSYLKEDSFYFDYELALPSDSDTIGTSIEFETRDTNFAKNATLYGSYDGMNWDKVTDDMLYSIDKKTKLSIGFTSPLKYTYYRLQLSNNLEQISFSAASIVYNIETSNASYFVEAFNPSFNVKSSDGKTVVSIEGLKNLRLDSVEIQTSSMFKRYACTSSGASKEIFNLSLNGEAYSDTRIPLARQIPQYDVFEVTITDADDKPIIIDGVTVNYCADEIVFEGEPGIMYTLEFGQDPAKRAPVYDIASYKEEIIRGGIDRVGISQIDISAEIPKGRDYTAVFNIVVAAAALLLGAVIVLKLVKKQA
ncbi:MAG: hypothetical protein FWG10_03740 [Eubacteriaceae bacterium]|nr:hypothetical protein [Eubacteriaceae bacterium]